MTRFPDEEPEAWEQDWEDWTDDRREVCIYCGVKGHKITRCPVVMEENA